MNRIKLIMAIVLLLCLLPMPYGYYVLVRFAAMVVFAVMAYQYYIKKRETMMITFGALTLLFQPIVRISLGHKSWQFIDVVVAFIIFYLLRKKKLIQT